MNIEERKQEIEQLTNDLKALIENRDIDGAKTKREEIRKAQELLQMEQEMEDSEKRELENQKNKESRKEENNMENREMNKDMEFRAISKFLANKEMTEEERASVNIGNSGAILPEAFVNQLQVLQKGFPALKPYCHVIPVKTNTGKMPVSTGSSTKKLAKLATDTEMVKDMITTSPVEFAVEDYGKIYPVENSVLDDAGVDFFNGLLAPDVAECSINSENEEILNIIKTNAKAGATGTNYKAIVKTLNTMIVPSLLKNTIIITNQTGYDYLDQLEDNNGRPLLVDSLRVEGGKTFKGREVVVLDDADLAPVTEGKTPFYIVNAYALIKFFDRKQYETATSKEAGFTYNQTFVRVVERFDAVKGDDRACFYVEL